MFSSFNTKKLFLAFTGFSILINTGCSNIMPNKGKTTEEFTVLQNSKLDDKGNIISGENYVFNYTRHEDPIPEAVDDEANYTVLFEINKNDIKSFSFENSSLSRINAMSAKLCFCPPEITSFKNLTEGSISGQMENSTTWKVNGKFDPTYSFSGEFKLK